MERLFNVLCPHHVRQHHVTINTWHPAAVRGVGVDWTRTSKAAVSRQIHASLHLRTATVLESCKSSLMRQYYYSSYFTHDPTAVIIQPTSTASLIPPCHIGRLDLAGRWCITGSEVDHALRAEVHAIARGDVGAVAHLAWPAPSRVDHMLLLEWPRNTV